MRALLQEDSETDERASGLSQAPLADSGECPGPEGSACAMSRPLISETSEKISSTRTTRFVPNPPQNASTSHSQKVPAMVTPTCDVTPQ